MYGHGQSHQEVDSNTVLFSSNIARNHVVMFFQMVKKNQQLFTTPFFMTQIYTISPFFKAIQSRRPIWFINFSPVGYTLLSERNLVPSYYT